MKKLLLLFLEAWLWFSAPASLSHDMRYFIIFGVVLKEENFGHALYCTGNRPSAGQWLLLIHILFLSSDRYFPFGIYIIEGTSLIIYDIDDLRNIQRGMATLAMKIKLRFFILRFHVAVARWRTKMATIAKSLHICGCRFFDFMMPLSTWCYAMANFSCALRLRERACRWYIIYRAWIFRFDLIESRRLFTLFIASAMLKRRGLLTSARARLKTEASGIIWPMPATTGVMPLVYFLPSFSGAIVEARPREQLTRKCSISSPPSSANIEHAKKKTRGFLHKMSPLGIPQLPGVTTATTADHPRPEGGITARQRSLHTPRRAV